MRERGGCFRVKAMRHTRRRADGSFGLPRRTARNRRCRKPHPRSMWQRALQSQFWPALREHGGSRPSLFLCLRRGLWGLRPRFWPVPGHRTSDPYRPPSICPSACALAHGIQITLSGAGWLYSLFPMLGLARKKAANWAAYFTHSVALGLVVRVSSLVSAHTPCGAGFWPCAFPTPIFIASPVKLTVPSQNPAQPHFRSPANRATRA